MSIAFLAWIRSNCMKRAVGCVIIKENWVMSIGYNGTPYNTKNCYDNGCQRCNSNTS